MEPLKPDVKQRILETTDATPQEIEEYETLQVKLHARRMSRQHNSRMGITLPETVPTVDPEEERVKELHAKFFGPMPEDKSQ